METQLESGTINQEAPVKEPVTTEQVPVVDNTPEPSKSEDLIQRVSKYVEDNKEDVEKLQQADDGETFDSNAIDKVASVDEAKELIRKQRQSYDRAYGKKFQELADLRKALEGKQENGAWTPERIRAEMNKPDFIQSAQTVASSQTEGTDEYSALSDTEKAEIKGLREKVVQLEQNNMRTSTLQQDEHLKSRYANYDSNAVDILTTDLLQGKVQATREHLWKVHDYENAVKRGYDLGRRDERSGVNEKVESIAAEGITTSQSDVVPKAEKGETDTSFWNRIAHGNLAKLAKAASLKK